MELSRNIQCRCNICGHTHSTVASQIQSNKWKTIKHSVYPYWRTNRNGKNGNKNCCVQSVVFTNMSKFTVLALSLCPSIEFNYETLLRFECFCLRIKDLLVWEQARRIIFKRFTIYDLHTNDSVIRRANKNSLLHTHTVRSSYLYTERRAFTMLLTTHTTHTRVKYHRCVRPLKQ